MKACAVLAALVLSAGLPNMAGHKTGSHLQKVGWNLTFAAVPSKLKRVGIPHLIRQDRAPVFFVPRKGIANTHHNGRGQARYFNSLRPLYIGYGLVNLGYSFPEASNIAFDYRSALHFLPRKQHFSKRKADNRADCFSLCKFFGLSTGIRRFLIHTGKPIDVCCRCSSYVFEETLYAKRDRIPTEHKRTIGDRFYRNPGPVMGNQSLTGHFGRLAGGFGGSLGRYGVSLSNLDTGLSITRLPGLSLFHRLDRLAELGGLAAKHKQLPDGDEKQQSREARYPPIGRRIIETALLVGIGTWLLSVATSRLMVACGIALATIGFALWWLTFALPSSWDWPF